MRMPSFSHNIVIVERLWDWLLRKPSLLRDAHPLRSPRGLLQTLKAKLINQQLLFLWIYLYKQVCDIIHKNKKKDVIDIFFALSVCGKEGIRTPETLLTFTRFPGGPVQPLLHLSFFRLTKIEKIFKSTNFFLFFGENRIASLEKRYLCHIIGYYEREKFHFRTLCLLYGIPYFWT